MSPVPHQTVLPPNVPGWLAQHLKPHRIIPFEPDSAKAAVTQLAICNNAPGPHRAAPTITRAQSHSEVEGRPPASSASHSSTAATLQSIRSAPSADIENATLLEMVQRLASTSDRYPSAQSLRELDAAFARIYGISHHHPEWGNGQDYHPIPRISPSERDPDVLVCPVQEARAWTVANASKSLAKPILERLAHFQGRILGDFQYWQMHRADSGRL